MGDVPRPPEATPLRRILEQVVMWLVLAATVGAAAWVSTEVNELGAPQAFDGITIQLPKRWLPTADHDGETFIELRERGEPTTARMLSVRRMSFSLRSLFRSAPARTEQVTLADGVVAKVSVVVNPLEQARRRGGPSWKELEVLAVFTTPGGEPLLIAIEQLSANDKSDANRNVELMKRVLATVRFTGAP
jgi:hypothetical protein